MKRIGVLTDENVSPVRGVDFSGLPYYALRKDYVDLIMKSGGLPILVPYEESIIDDYIDLCDGFILVGGSYAFYRHWYQSVPEDFFENLSFRRQFEIVFTKSLLKSMKPVLGICCGMQVMCGVNNSKIHYDLSREGTDGRINHRSTGSDLSTHHVDLVAGTKLHDIFGRSQILVNSAHREGVVSVEGPLLVSARSQDGLIEAVEIPDHPFAIGVQWHPELGAGSRGPQIELFSALVRALGQPS